VTFGDTEGIVLEIHMAENNYVRWLDTVTLDDLSLVGGKNASLGELAGVRSAGIKVPEGFAVTAAAYRDLLASNQLWLRMDEILKETDWSDLKAGAEMSARLREMVVTAKLPPGLELEIREAYQKLRRDYGRNVAVAVRSSATAEDLPGASFAGQHETFLNIRGAENLVDSVRRCFASLFTQRAISYRKNKGFDHKDVALSVGIQRMIRADMASSGVIFTLDTESGNRDIVMVTGLWGLGEAIVQGIADPDEFLVHKPTLKLGHEYVLRRRIGSKKTKLVYATAKADEPRSGATYVARIKSGRA
jgi:pyruvate,water dikinase